MQSLLVLLIATGGFVNAAEQPTLPEYLPQLPAATPGPEYHTDLYVPAAGSTAPTAPAAPNPPKVNAVGADGFPPLEATLHEAPAHSAAPYLPSGFKNSIKQAIATVPPAFEVVKQADGSYREKVQPVAGAQHPTVDVKRAKHSPTLGEKFEANSGILKDKHSGGGLQSANRDKEIVQHMEDSEVNPMNLAISITGALHHPRTTFSVFAVLLITVAVLFVVGLRKLVKSRPDIMEEGADAPPQGDLEARWQQVETTWQRSTDMNSFLRIVTHGQAREQSQGLMQGAQGGIEMYQAPQKHSYQAPQEQKQPKKAPHGQSFVLPAADVTDGYETLQTPR